MTLQTAAHGSVQIKPKPVFGVVLHGVGCRVAHHRRIHTLLFVLAMHLIWAIRTGEWLISQGQLILQKRFKSGKAERPLMSVFRQALDHLQDIAFNKPDFQALTKLLSCN